MGPLLLLTQLCTQAVGACTGRTAASWPQSSFHTDCVAASSSAASVSAGADAMRHLLSLYSLLQLLHWDSHAFQVELARLHRLGSCLWLRNQREQ